MSLTWIHFLSSEIGFHFFMLILCSVKNEDATPLLSSTPLLSYAQEVSSIKISKGIGLLK
jgi:hypothetical protein